MNVKGRNRRKGVKNAGKDKEMDGKGRNRRKKIGNEGKDEDWKEIF